MPEAELWNQYGLTESCADITSFNTSTPRDVSSSADGIVPLGRPIDNVEVHVFDAALQPVPKGQAGELCISGDALALGYVGQPYITSRRFVAHPRGDEHGPMYRTGDLVRVREGRQPRVSRPA